MPSRESAERSISRDSPGRTTFARRQPGSLGAEAVRTGADVASAGTEDASGARTVPGTGVSGVFVAGRYRGGAWSDRWTDVTRCAAGTFTAYAPSCTCGWRGPAQPPDQHGLLDCRAPGVSVHACAQEL